MKFNEALELLIETIIQKEDGWYVVSEKTGKNLGGPYKTEEEAKVRLRQVEFFKRFGAKIKKAVKKTSQPKLIKTKVKPIKKS